jgi:hypothetical protein
MKKSFILSLLLIFYLLTLFGCSRYKSPYAPGSLEIQFNFNKPAGNMEPSYQIAIWLEDLNGLYIKSLLVSEYLSYGGYNDSTICPMWRKKADWDNVSDEEFNAVTQATPDVSFNSIQINCKEFEIVPGKYKYLVQAHIQERYNIAYTGEIELGQNPAEHSANVAYYPERHPDAGEVLSDVLVKYKL